jgi:hypothetical protein
LICYFGQDWWYFPQICHCIVLFHKMTKIIVQDMHYAIVYILHFQFISNDKCSHNNQCFSS